jgi:hypothetical protein
VSLAPLLARHASHDQRGRLAGGRVRRRRFRLPGVDAVRVDAQGSDADAVAGLRQQLAQAGRRERRVHEDDVGAFQRAGARTRAGRAQLDAVGEDRESAGRERRQWEHDRARESHQVEQHQVVAKAPVEAPRLPDEARLAAAGQVLLAAGGGRRRVVRVLEQQHAIGSTDPSAADLFVECAGHAAAHAGDTAVDTKSRQPEQYGVRSPRCHPT